MIDTYNTPPPFMGGWFTLTCLLSLVVAYGAVLCHL